jgi:LuxR family maltose regulon positive regulatory protein
MCADADEAAHRFAAQNLVRPVATLLQGIARVLSGDPGRADAFFQDVVSVRQEGMVPEVLWYALCERSLLAMARGDWSQAEILAGEAGTAMRGTGLEDVLVYAVQARMALHHRDIPGVHRHLVSAQRLRSLQTYAQPHLAVQVRIELTRVHLALGDLVGARTLMQEVHELLTRRPGLGTLADEARVLQAQLSKERGSSALGASALTAAELRVLPMLSSHLSMREIAAELFVSPHTVRSQAMSIYRKLGTSSRSQAVARSRELGLLEG